MSEISLLQVSPSVAEHLKNRLPSIPGLSVEQIDNVKALVRRIKAGPREASVDLLVIGSRVTGTNTLIDLLQAAAPQLPVLLLHRRRSAPVAVPLEYVRSGQVTLVPEEEIDAVVEVVLRTMLVRIGWQARRQRHRESSHADPTNEQRFQQLVASVEDHAICLLDPQGRVSSWNLGGEHIFGYHPDAILGRHIFLFYTLADMRANLPGRHLQQARKHGHAEAEGWRLREDGSRLWAHVSLTALRDESGRLEGFAQIVRDLSPRRETEQALRRTVRRLRRILDSAADHAIITLDMDGRITHWNHGAHRLLGYAADEVLGHAGAMLFSEMDRQRHAPEQEIQQAAHDEGVSDERWYVHKDGSRFWGASRVSVMHNAEGEVCGYVKIVQDRTSDKHQQDRLEARSCQYQALARLGHQALAGAVLPTLLDASVQAVARTLGVEMCEVLERLPDERQLCLKAGVGWRPGLVGEAMVQAEPDSQVGYTLRVNRPVVVTDLQQDTRFTGSQRLLEHKVVSGLSMGIMDEKGQPVGILGAYTRDRRQFTADEVRFVQAAANLLGAAIGHQTLKRQLTQIPTQAPGYAPALDQGRPGEHEADVVSTRPSRPPRKPRKRRPDILRVMVVDDHELMREGPVNLLNAHPGITVVGEAADGETAVRLARALRPDVVIMDITMPGLNGIEATRQITAAQPNIRVIGLSVHGRPDMAATMHAAGAEGYLCKNGPVDHLIAAIRGEWLSMG
ncbi:MAG: PAS domain S-box protein [Phycisphaeraceae bacterium]